MVPVLAAPVPVPMVTVPEVPALGFVVPVLKVPTLVSMVPVPAVPVLEVPDAPVPAPMPPAPIVDEVPDSPDPSPAPVSMAPVSVPEEVLECWFTAPPTLVELEEDPSWILCAGVRSHPPYLLACLRSPLL